MEFKRLGACDDFTTWPMLFYEATEEHNAPLPELGECGGERVRIEDCLRESTLCLALTQYSATAPLSLFTQRYPTLRGASLPRVERRMQETALAADYTRVGERYRILKERLERSIGARLTFSTGDRLSIDLRYRPAHTDDGNCRPGGTPTIINLPGGESFKVPYEGERPGDPSRTSGVMPMVCKGKIAYLHVEENRIVDVSGDDPITGEMRQYFSCDRGRQNIAELGLGCNEYAVVTGNVLEDEKVGPHIAYGRSDHLGGIVGPEQFDDPRHVVHHDTVYAKGCTIETRSLVLEYADEVEEEILRDGKYLLF